MVNAHTVTALGTSIPLENGALLAKGQASVIIAKTDGVVRGCRTEFLNATAAGTARGVTAMVMTPTLSIFLPAGIVVEMGVVPGPIVISVGFPKKSLL